MTTEGGLEVNAYTTRDTHEESSSLSWTRIVVAILLSTIVIFTIASNLVVLIAFFVEKKLRNSFTYLIANLALTDLLVGLTGMAFYTVDTVMGYWPFGPFMCGVWIFCDYGMIFASVFTLVAISADRFWAVTWTHHYRANNSKHKIICCLIVIWFLVVIICLPQSITDRIQPNERGVCWWDPGKNMEFAYFLALVGHHLPCAVIIFCCVRVFVRTRKHLKIRANEIQMTRMQSVGIISGIQPCPGPGLEVRPTGGLIVTSIATSIATDHNTQAPLSRDVHASSASHEKLKKERRIFVTLTYILVTYLICWVPFHIIFDLSFISPGLVPTRLYTFCFWLTYVNSTLNPIIYAFGNKDIRDVAKRVISCHFKA